MLVQIVNYRIQFPPFNAVDEQKKYERGGGETSSQKNRGAEKGRGWHEHVRVVASRHTHTKKNTFVVYIACVLSKGADHEIGNA